MILKGSSEEAGTPAAIKADPKSTIARFKGLVELSASSISMFETGLTEVRGKLGALQTLEATSLQACERASLILIVQTEMVMPMVDEATGQGFAKRRDNAISEISSHHASIASFIEEVNRIDEFSQTFVNGFKIMKGQIESIAKKLERIEADETIAVSLEVLDAFERGYVDMESRVTETNALSTEICGRMTALCRNISSIINAITVSLTALNSVFAPKPASGVGSN